MKTRLLSAILFILISTVKPVMVLAEGEAVPAVEPVTEPAAQVPAPAAPAAAEEEAPSGDYEIDYEEEPDAAPEADETETADEAPAKRPGKSSGKRAMGASGPAVQGTHSKNRFNPLLKSDTRSIYKKNGKSLDVDTD